MLIPLTEARQTVAAALPITVLRAAPDALHPHWLRDTGHYFLGAVPLRGLKRSGQWHVDDTDLAPAVRALAETAGSPGRLIPAGLPWSSLERSDPSRDDWRLAVQWELLCRAAAARPRKKPADLLDAGLDPVAQHEAVTPVGRILARCEPPRVEPLVIGGIAVMDLVTRRSGSWYVPAGWAAVLDSWQHSRLELLAEARRGAGCGVPAADRGQE
ncbi:hypothetical protein [Kitasatospora sp. NPDC002040]|uniref:hypothetical protein n=1 Tax=Kitasatospora sp. NPDC002040 TaxID=3154661 RepID=UPI00331C79DC